MGLGLGGGGGIFLRGISEFLSPDPAEFPVCGHAIRPTGGFAVGSLGVAVAYLCACGGMLVDLWVAKQRTSPNEIPRTETFDELAVPHPDGRA
ncbi:hypothetical protein FAIPA1_10384 [Frankia sp. AiPs1]